MPVQRPLTGNSRRVDCWQFLAVSFCCPLAWGLLYGNQDVISRGGYPTTLIDATQVYLRKLILRAHDANYLSGPLEDYVGDSVERVGLSVAGLSRRT